jgi:hypothetical protein
LSYDLQGEIYQGVDHQIFLYDFDQAPRLLFGCPFFILLLLKRLVCIVSFGQGIELELFLGKLLLKNLEIFRMELFI